MKTNMNLPYPALLAAALLLALPPLAAQDIPTIILDQVEDKLMDELEDRLNPADSTDIDGEGWDDTYRTSAAEGERSTQWKLGKDTPPNGRRVGCVCMDDTRLDQKGWGACGGRGGVRFWLYGVAPDSIVPVATERHWEHPEPLSEAERANLAANNPDQPLGAPAPGGGGMGSFYQLIATMMICLTVAYVAYLWFGKSQEE